MQTTTELNQNSDTWPKWVDDFTERKDPQHVGAFGTVIVKNNDTGAKAVALVLVHGSEKAYFVEISPDLARSLMNSIQRILKDLGE